MRPMGSTQVIEIAPFGPCSGGATAAAPLRPVQTGEGCGKTPVWAKDTHGFAGSPASRSAKDSAKHKD